MKSIRFLELLAFAVAALIGFTHVGLASQTDSDIDSISDTIVAKAFMEKPPLLWQSDLQDDVVLQTLLPDGKLFVVTDSGGCLSLNADNGSVAWAIRDLGGMKSAKFVAIPNTTVGCLLEYKSTSEYNSRRQITRVHYYNSLVVIDYSAGNVLWKSDRFGYASVHGFFSLPSVDGLMLYGRDTTKTTWTTAASLRNGELIWRHDSLFGEEGAELIGSHPESDDLLNGQQKPIFDSDSTMILFMDKEAIRRVDIRSGRVLWRVSIRAHDVPAPIEGFGQAVLSSDFRTVYYPVDKSLVAIRTSDGAFVWKSMPKLPGRIYQMELGPKGILLWGGPDPGRAGGHDYLTLIDTATGNRGWKRDFRKIDHKFTSNFVLTGDKVFIYSTSKLWSLELASGDNKMLTNSVKFDKNEFGPVLEHCDSFLILSGNNCLTKIRQNGEQVYASRFPTPSDARFLGSMIGAFAGYIIGAVAFGQRVFFYPDDMPGAAESTATRRDRNFNYILTNVRDETGRKPGLVKVNRLTGKAEKGIKLGDRQPLYTSDETKSRLYYVRDGHFVECYEF